MNDKGLTSSSSLTHFLRYCNCTWGLPSMWGWGVLAALSSSTTCPPRRWLASGGCGNELVVFIFPLNLWYKEAILVLIKQLKACQRHKHTQKKTLFWFICEVSDDSSSVLMEWKDQLTVSKLTSGNRNESVWKRYKGSFRLSFVLARSTTAGYRCQ